MGVNITAEGDWVFQEFNAFRDYLHFLGIPVV